MVDGPHRTEKESWDNQLGFGSIRFKFLFDVPVHGVGDESFFANFEMGRLVDERCGLEATANKIYLIYIQIEPLIIIFRLASKLMIYLNQKQNY